MQKRVVIILLDGVGVGEAPDAVQYGDVGSNSVGNTAKAVGGLNLPNMGNLGLGNIVKVPGVPPCQHTLGAFGRLCPQSAGKDSVSGHWELMGVCLQEPLPTYPHGFPEEIIKEFRDKTQLDILGNKAASGTEIIQEFGLEHMRTGKPIVYTSADSVFQIAAHEEIIPVNELYNICQIARSFLVGKHAIGRVIARPFKGTKPGEFYRTENRHDFALEPIAPTVMDRLVQSGKEVRVVGKIHDIFAGRGITHSVKATNNTESIDGILSLLEEDFEGLLFANLIEFDMIYGHRNDPYGYASALETFDQHLPQIRENMTDSDIAMIVADHGIDPTTSSTDHSREYVPLLVFGSNIKQNVNLGTRTTYSDVAATLAEHFSLQKPDLGRSFLNEILEKS